MFKKIYPILLLVFVNTLGFSILIPVLPFIVRNTGNDEFIYGLIIASYSLFQFIGSPLLGKLSDRHGRKSILFLSQAGTLLSWIIMGIAWWVDTQIEMHNLALIIIAFARVLDGITGGNNSVANAYLSDIVPNNKKHIAFGFAGATLGLGMIIGPAIGAMTSNGSIGYLGMILFSIAVSSVTLLLIGFFLKESIKEKNPTPIDFKERLLFWRSIQSFSSKPMVMLGLKARFFTAITMSAYTTTIALLLIDQFSFNVEQLGNFLFFVGSFLIINQVMTKYFTQWIGIKNILWSGLFLMGLGLFIFPTLNNILLFVVFYYITNLGLSILLPTIKSVLSNHVTSKQQGEILGLDESIQALSMAIIPALAGLAYQFLAWKSFWIPAAISILGSLLIKINLTQRKNFDDSDIKYTKPKEKLSSSN